MISPAISVFMTVLALASCCWPPPGDRPPAVIPAEYPVAESEVTESFSGDDVSSEDNSTAEAPETGPPAEEMPAAEPSASESPSEEPPSEEPSPEEASHVHQWEDIIATVHHEAVTEEVWVVDQEAWDETVPLYETIQTEKCRCRCGMLFDSAEEQWAHAESFSDEEWEQHAGWTSEVVTEEVPAGEEVIHHPEEGHWEVRTIQEAWDEAVVTGQRCAVCGAVTENQ